MRIRIHKKLGWGLTGLERDPNTGVLTDPRINADALIHHPDEVGPKYLAYLDALLDAERRPGVDVEQSDEWFNLSVTISMVKAAQEQDGILPWPVTCEAEAGRRDVLLIQPVGFPRWSRYGDPIDYAEESALHEPVEPRIVPQEFGIHPFEGLYMDSRTGRRLDTTAKRLIDLLTTKQKKREDRRYSAAADHLARASGFDNADQALKYAVPLIPDDILHVASWLNLFNGPDVWLQLRPMLYVYWS